MCLESGIVPVVPGDDVVRIHSLNELDLGITDLRAVDGERLDPHPPEGHGIECSFHEHHDLALGGGVVEEVLGDIDALGVKVLRPIRSEVATDDSKDGPICSTQRISNCIVLGIAAQSEVSGAVNTHPVSPIGMEISCVPAVEP